MEAQILETVSDETPKSINSKYYQTLNRVISSGSSKEFLGRLVSLKELDSMGADEIEAYYKIYELNYGNKIGEGIVLSFMGAYSKFMGKILPIDSAEKLEEDLRNDYVIKSELKNIIGQIAINFGGKLMASLSLCVITFQHVKLPSLKPPSEIEKEQCKEQ